MQSDQTFATVEHRMIGHGPAVIAYLDANLMAFDIDGDLSVDPLTDGLLIVRYLRGMTGTALIQDAIGNGASRNTATLVERYLGTLVP